VLRSGWIGNITRTAEGRYTTELRGLTQALSQGILRTYGVGCDAELGDARCKVLMAPFTYERTVAVVHTRRYFQIDVALGAAQVIGGRVTFNTGANAGRSMEIKAYSSMQMELWLPMPEDFAAGDEITIVQGCDKTREMCINTYNNILNFRGHGVFVPGDTEILKVGKQ